MFENRDKLSGSERGFRLAALFLLMALLIAPLFIAPDQLPLPDCHFKNITGLDCPTCGFTRGYFAAARADFFHATRLHIFAPILYLTLWLNIILLTAELLSRKKLFRKPAANIRKFVAYSLIFLFVAHWIFKMIG